MKKVQQWMLAGALTCSTMATAETGLLLAEAGKTLYRIVIAENAAPAERFAAEELASFLKEMTGAQYPVVADSEPRSNCELVLGETSRNVEIPDEFKPSVIEGYALLRDGDSLQIRGRGPRATLYGVYDFLDQDLGVRFLAFDGTHVPKTDTLLVQMSSRKYDPPLDYRNIISCGDEGEAENQWALRARLNSVWGYSPMGGKVGGLRHLGGFVHNLPTLIPHDQYFDSHPEYYAMVGGARRKMQYPSGKFSSQPCLSNPEVKGIVAESIRKIITEYRKRADFPDDQILIPVDYHDHGQICECEACARINQEEDTDGGTLFRFMNALSDELTAEFPNLTLSTLAYGPTLKPPKSPLRKNIVLRFAPIGGDFARAFNDPESPNNRINMSCLDGWKVTGNRMYVWYYAGNFNDDITPHPDLKGLDLNFKILLDSGMKGMFVETVQHAGIELKELRSYILARKLWRPETDLRQATEEFCHLYYGNGGEKALEYLDWLHEWYYTRVSPDGNNPLTLRGAPPYGHAYTKEFLDKADQILDAAEAAAGTERQKLRVAVLHMPVWHLRLREAMTSERRVVAFPTEWRFKTDPQKTISPQEKTAEWQTIRIDNFWTKQPGFENYHGAAWYAADFILPEKLVGERLSFYFAAVDGTVDLYIDGKKVGEQQRPIWNEGFYFHLPEKLAAGKHELKVRVEKDFAAAGIWKEVALMNLAQEVSSETRTVAKRYMAADVNFVPKRRNPEYRKVFFDRIHTLLQAVPQPPPDAVRDGSISRNAASLNGGHRTFEVIDDPTALTGKCVRQYANRKWTLGQAVNWRVGEHLEQNPQQAFRLRVRIKVLKKGDAGQAFTIGFCYQNQNWSGGNCTPTMLVKASDVRHGEWAWYEYPHLLKYRKYDRPQLVAVFAADNPENIDSILVDMYEIYPVQEEGAR